MHGSRRRELETEHPVMVTAVKRPAGETRGKVAAGPDAGQMPPRQLPTLHPAFASRICNAWMALASWSARQG